MMQSTDWWQILVTAVVTVMASSGFWTYMQRKDVKKSELDKLVLGLAYDKIISMGMNYIERAWITKDEYEDYRKYLYEPYKALGGNGVTERIMAEVSSLPLRPRSTYVEVLREVKERRSENEQTHADELIS